MRKSVFGTCPMSGQENTSLVLHNGEYMSSQSRMIRKIQEKALRVSDRANESEKNRFDIGYEQK